MEERTTRLSVLLEKEHRAERLNLCERKVRTDVNEELNNLYTSTRINWVIKSRRMRYTEHATRMGAMRKCWKSICETES